MTGDSRTLYILVGASCAGKTGFMKKALKVADLGVVISITTRAFREPPFFEEDVLSYGRQRTQQEYEEMRARGDLWSDVRYRTDNYGLSDAEFRAVLDRQNGIIPLVPEVAEKCWERYQERYNVIILVLEPTPSQLLANMRHRGVANDEAQAKIIKEAGTIAVRQWRVPVTRLYIEKLEDYQTLAQTIFGPRAEPS